MNFTPEFGWYYRSPDDRTPSWAGVPFFWDFMTRREPSPGPWGMDATLNFLRPGDFVQLRFQGGEGFAHTPVVVSVGSPPDLSNILVAAHSNDADDRPLDTYEHVAEMRYLHILGAIAPEQEEGGSQPDGAQ